MQKRVLLLFPDWRTCVSEVEGSGDAGESATGDASEKSYARVRVLCTCCASACPHTCVMLVVPFPVIDHSKEVQHREQLKAHDFLGLCAEGAHKSGRGCVGAWVRLRCAVCACRTTVANLLAIFLTCYQNLKRTSERSKPITVTSKEAREEIFERGCWLLTSS